MIEWIQNFFSGVIPKLLLNATLETLYMTFVSTALAFILGLVLAIVLILTRRGGLCENRIVYAVLDVAINMLRSFPFIILLIVLFPLTNEYRHHRGDRAAYYRLGPLYRSPHRKRSAGGR